MIQLVQFMFCFQDDKPIGFKIISFILSSISFKGKIEPTKNDLAPNLWLHSSVGRASHRYSR